MEEISISNAIKITSGTCRYQYLLLCACGLLIFACSISINSLPFMFSPLSDDMNVTASLQLTGYREWLRRHLPKQFYLGIAFSAIPASFLIDKFGRKSIITQFIPYYITLSIFASISILRKFLGKVLFIQGILFFVLVSAALLLVTESVHSKSKPVYLLCLALCYVLGHLYSDLMFLLNVNWRITYSSSFFFGLLSYFLLSKTQESAEWVLSKGKTLETQEILKKISIINKSTPLDQKLIVANSLPYKSIFQLLSKYKQKITIFSILWLCLIMSCTAIYYSPVKLSENIYKNYMFYFILHLISLLLIWLLKTQQKFINVLFSVLLLSRVGLILLSLCDPHDTNYWLSSSLIIIVRLSLDIEMFYIANLTFEVFGIDMRGLGFGLCITFGAVGGFLVFGYPWYSYIIGIHVDVCAGIFSFLSLFVSLFIRSHRMWMNALREIEGDTKEFMLLEIKS